MNLSLINGYMDFAFYLQLCSVIMAMTSVTMEQQFEDSSAAECQVSSFFSYGLFNDLLSRGQRHSHLKF